MRFFRYSFIFFWLLHTLKYFLRQFIALYRKRSKCIYMQIIVVNLPAAEMPCNMENIKRNNVRYFIQNISDLAKVWFLTSSHIVVIQFCGCCFGLEKKRRIQMQAKFLIESADRHNCNSFQEYTQFFNFFFVCFSFCLCGFIVNIYFL